MKELLAVISLLVSGAVAEPPAPYPPSGWRPQGTAFELPPRDQQPSQYLPPLDPRNPSNIPNVQYGTREDDVSVQGLPVQEEVPFFQQSPISGKQTVGPSFNFDIQNLNNGYQQSQYQLQQQRYREYERQKQIEDQLRANRLNRPSGTSVPAQFVPRTTPTTTEASTTPEATTFASTTDSTNEGDAVSSKKSEKIKVEVSKQKIQEYPGELFLSSLAQLQLQPQFVPLQFGQLNAPLILPGSAQSQKQVAGYDAQIHFAALPSILAQQQLQQQKVEQPALVIAQQQAQPVAAYQPQIQPAVAYQPQAQPAVTYQPQPQYSTEQVAVQPQVFYGQPEAEQAVQPQLFYSRPETEQVAQFQPQGQYQPAPQLPPQPVILQPQANQLQPQSVFQQQPQPGQFQPQPAQFQPQLGQFQPQSVQFQPQPAQFQPQQPEKDAESIDNGSYQQIYQQPIVVQQPANQYQPQFQSQPGLIQAQLVNYPGQDLSQFQQQYQGRFQSQRQLEQQNQYQPQNQGDALQSGLDVNQQGNDLEEPKDQDNGGEEGTTATAIATAFGARTQPRQFTQYGAPFPVPKVQAAPNSATTESNVEEVTSDDGPIVAHAVAIADGSKKKSAKLRRYRIRPIFTLDKSGHLVLAQGQ